jgi:hypothetical protein
MTWIRAGWRRLSEKTPAAVPWLPVTCVLVLCALASAVIAWAIPVPRCFWRAILGWPCPLCGSTRCLAALGRLHWWEAFTFNPLVFLTSLAILVGTILALAGFDLRPAAARIRPVRVHLLILAVLLNWGYLIASRHAPAATGYGW